MIEPVPILSRNGRNVFSCTEDNRITVAGHPAQNRSRLQKLRVWHR
ncbi:MAG TPA: hypothetical protein VGR73_12770 [Bryobacteraceae bacterium]|nr:hypothetical protein [Bryobacteraceae bacterium]